MPIELPAAWIITLNIIGWPVIHIALAMLFVRLPQTCFRIDAWLFKSRRWEGRGAIYQKFTGVRRWKRLLPDGALFLRGFAKKRLLSPDHAYITTFIRETCRAELAHWCMILAAPIFFVWNPLWADGVICIYALAANLPCIITQRYNRIRLQRLYRADTTG